MVTVEMEFVDRRPSTRASLTKKGQRAIADYWQRLETLRRQAMAWKPQADYD